MKVAVVCANGKAGQMITKEAVQRGLDVTAVAGREQVGSAPVHKQRCAGHHGRRPERF